ncbi:MAG: hypothetical protein NTV08_08350, partial [Verrucomicrobia bacterium]|nr:hypothetical protein [Verrucomicrobiota bacterium]
FGDGGLDGGGFTRDVFLQARDAFAHDGIGSLGAAGFHLGEFAEGGEARGKAHVHVVIIGFGAGDVTGKRIFDYEADASAPTEIPASNISPYLVAGPDTALRNLSAPLGDVPKMSWGNKPTDGGHFLLSPQERQEMIAAEPEAAQFIRRYMGGEDFLNNQERYCLWLKDAAPGVLRRLPRVMARVEAVRTSRLASRAPTTRDYARLCAAPDALSPNRTAGR